MADAVPLRAARPVTGAAAIALALLFNAPYAVLAATYAYPGILRAPPGEALTLFAQGGAGLILTWHAFALSALALIPLALALALETVRIRTMPGLAVGAAIVGALAGLAQAIGLWRWVFVVPSLAATYVDPATSPAARDAAAATFAVLNSYAGVAIGEHLGQMLTAAFVALVALMQGRERRGVTAGLGALTAAAILVGAQEGVALAVGASGAVFSLSTIAGFLALTVWLIATGLGLIRGAPSHRQ